MLLSIKPHTGLCPNRLELLPPGMPATEWRVYREVKSPHLLWSPELNVAAVGSVLFKGRQQENLHLAGRPILSNTELVPVQRK